MKIKQMWKKLTTDVSMEILSTWTEFFIFSIILPNYLLLSFCSNTSPHP